MPSVNVIADTLTALLPKLSRTSSVVDEAARLGQYPHANLVDSVVSQARVLEDAALDLAGIPGYESLARTLGHDAISTARKGGVMHGMNQSRSAFDYGWNGQFHKVVSDVTTAVQQLN